MTAELQKKKEAKFDAGLTGECVQWMVLVLRDGGLDDDAANLEKALEDGGDCSSKNFAEKLKDGQLLCKLFNCIVKSVGTQQSNEIKKINTSTVSFKAMENIGNFTKGCESIGCKTLDMFQTVDLHESQNIPQVVNGIIALGRMAQTIGYSGPVLGPAESTENKRDFTEEQLRAGDAIIGLQAGSNQGASQAGQNFGKTRSIMD